MACARAAVEAFSSVHSELVDLSIDPKPLSGSRSGSSFVFRARGSGQTVVVKLTLAGSSREFLAARWFPNLAPRVLAHATFRELIHSAIDRGEFRFARELDRGFLTCVALEEIPGAPLPAWPTNEALRRAARAIATLHGCGVKRGVPDLAMPSRPTALHALACEYLREVTRAGWLSTRARRAVRRAVDAAEARARRSFKRSRLREIRRPCHGDLRLENILDDGESARLIDFDHAGIGDPAVDLAMFVSRNPLSKSQALRVLDAYAEVSPDRGILDRYFGLAPLVAITGALGALLDLRDVELGRRSVTDRRDQVTTVFPRVMGELEVAIRGAGVSWDSDELFEPARRARLGVWVTVDGTAASQKTPLAAALAAELGVPHFNTGAFYRFVALVALERGLDASMPRDRTKLLAELERRKPTLLPDGTIESIGRERIGRRSSEVLEAPSVELSVADWAAIPKIRQVAEEVFRAAFVTEGGVVEGRDAGTVLVADAALKIFVDAPIEARAAWLARRSGLRVREARRRIEIRDAKDRGRRTDPLRPAPGAVRVEARPDAVASIAHNLAERLRRRP